MLIITVAIQINISIMLVLQLFRQTVAMALPAQRGKVKLCDAWGRLRHPRSPRRPSRRSPQAPREGASLQAEGPRKVLHTSPPVRAPQQRHPPASRPARQPPRTTR
ncbi:hypothetical protein BD413DRAFT_212052 [Trametes elegans]|nr:hypothetical protein BD413DRAFT_212052 [Trametes elegans]